MNKLVIITLVLIVSACSTKSNKIVDKLYYRFPDAQEYSNVQLIIARPTALGIIGNRPMVAENTDGALRQMQHNFWLDSPKILLRIYLEKSFATKTVNPSELSTLNTHILKLEKKQNSAVVSIKFTVTNANNIIVYDKIYSQSLSLATNSISSYVNSTSELINELVNQFAQDVR